MPNTVEVAAPEYVARYPSLRKIQLAAVKEGLFHPRLPTFRRMDMDTAAHRLPDEHCRTTTTCGPVDFSSARATYFRPSTQRYSGATICEEQQSWDVNTEPNITDTGRSLRESLHNDLKSLNIDWDGAKEVDSIDPKQAAELRFSGYAVRYLKPAITSSWRYTFKQEPRLDQYGQRPIPANIYSRYRDSYPRYSRSVAIEAYR